MPESLYTITIGLTAALGEDQVGRFAEDFAGSFTEGQVYSTSLLRREDPFHGPWQVQWLISRNPDPADTHARLNILAAVHGVVPETAVIEPVPDINWLEHSYRQFPPIIVGRFFIHGSHNTDPIPPGMTSLQIDAATAFGSGDHGTTAGCLLLMQALEERGFVPRQILDMGCGSGILSIGACQLWPAPVLAADIDPESVRVTAAHRAANKIGDQLTIRCGDGFTGIDGHYDLVIANILPQPLKTMAPDLIARLSAGGYVILSGMLADQVDGVMPHYTDAGLVIDTRLDRGEWSAVLLKKS